MPRKLFAWADIETVETNYIVVGNDYPKRARELMISWFDRLA